MSLKRFISLSVYLILIGSIIAGAWVYLTGGIHSFDDFKHLRPMYIVFLILLTCLCLLYRFLRWQYLLRRIGIRVPTRSSLSIYLASLTGIATPAYLGESIRGLFLRRQFGVPFRITMWLLVVERLYDIAALSIIGIFTANIWGMQKIMVLIVIGACAAGIIGALVARSLGVPGAVMANLAKRRVIVQSLVISVIAWIPASLLISTAVAGLGKSLDVITGMGIFSTATLLGSVTFMPAGIGSVGSLAILQLENVMPLIQGVAVVSLVRLMSTGVGLAIGALFLIFELKVRKKANVKEDAAHFNEISNEYKDQFTSHVWNHLLDRRISLLTSNLPHSFSQKSIGLDIGCGLGLQCRAMSKRGYRVIGIDSSLNLAKQARLNGVPVINGDALLLPFQDMSVDYVYAIGSLHHLPGIDAQSIAYKEILRVLKPGGLLIVHETNTRNPLFRLYMGYIFPIMKSIDEGTEWWIKPQRWARREGMKVLSLRYFTFMPDFIPQYLMRPFLSIERWAEESRWCYYSVHYMAVLQKDLK